MDERRHIRGKRRDCAGGWVDLEKVPRLKLAADEAAVGTDLQRIAQRDVARLRHLRGGAGRGIDLPEVLEELADENPPRRSDVDAERIEEPAVDVVVIDQGGRDASRRIDPEDVEPAGDEDRPRLFDRDVARQWKQRRRQRRNRERGGIEPHEPLIDVDGHQPPRRVELDDIPGVERSRIERRLGAVAGSMRHKSSKNSVMTMSPPPRETFTPWAQAGAAAATHAAARSAATILECRVRIMPQRPRRRVVRGAVNVPVHPA